MFTIQDKIYTPRNDNLVQADLKNGIIPPEFKEQLKLAEGTIPNAITTELKAIVAELVAAAKALHPNLNIPTPSIYLSAEATENAFSSNKTLQPLIIVNSGLIKNVGTKDELVAVIAHELGHIIMRQNAKDEIGNRSERAEECSADIIAVHLMAKAQYNPYKFIDNLRRHETNLVNFSNLSKQTHYDDHPSCQIRIRTIENAIVKLKRDGIVINVRSQAISQAMKSNINNLEYRSPLLQGMMALGYFNASTTTETKIKILDALLKEYYTQNAKNNSLWEIRIDEIGSHIQDLKVDFSQNNIRKAMLDLSDTIFQKLPSDVEGGHVRAANLYKPLQIAWENSNPNASPEDNTYPGKLGELRKAIKAFTKAKNAEEADKQALIIMELCRVIDPKYKGGMLELNLTGHTHDKNWRSIVNPEGFFPHKKEHVMESIRTTGRWSPPYKKHVNWCKQGKYPNIATILRGMELYHDHWARDIIGDNPEHNISPTLRLSIQQYTHDDLSEAYYDYDLCTLLQSEYEYLRNPEYDTVTRNDQGDITNITHLQPIPGYPWPNIANRQAHKQAAAGREQHENQLVQNTDWSLLKTNFKRFFYLYKYQLAPSRSLAPINYPFAKRFIDELKQILPTASEEYKEQVLSFFAGGDEADNLSYYYPPSWDNSEMEDPKLYTMKHPLIQFMMTEPGKSFITDACKTDYYSETKGFVHSNTAQGTFLQQFTIPLSHALQEYPLQCSINELINKHGSDCSSLAIIVELERICHEKQDTLTLEELNMLRYIFIANKYRIDQFSETNLKTFFKEVERKTLERHLKSRDLPKLIAAYKYAVASHLVLEYPEMIDTTLQSIQALMTPLTGNVNAVLSESTKLAYFQELLHVTQFQSPDRLENYTYNGHIDNPQYREWAIDQYSTLLAAQLKQDDLSSAYFARAQAAVKNIIDNTKGVTRANLLSQLADKINAQPKLVYHIRDTYHRILTKDLFSHHMTAVVTELHLNEAATDPGLRQELLQFLMSPLTANSHDSLLAYIQRKNRCQFISYDRHGREHVTIGSQININNVLSAYQLQNYHRDFWALSLEARAIYLEKILFPLNDHDEDENQYHNRPNTDLDERHIIQDIIQIVFPTAGNVDQTNNTYARKIISAYLNSADHEESRLLASAVMAANITGSGTQQVSVGKKLHTVLSSMGPAGGKLLQAIHSHPQTPEDIRRDIGSCKTNYDPPLRWDLVKYVEDCGMLQGSPKVDYIGKVVGSGSFGVTVFNRLDNGDTVADTLLRPNAANRATRELELMRKAATELVKTDSKLQPILDMIHEAKRSAIIETNMKLSMDQNRAAEYAYNDIEVAVTLNGRTTTLKHGVAQQIGYGNNYKRVRIAEGKHFVDLPDNEYKQAVAKAMITTQFTLLLAGIATDADRHGGNIKVQNNMINHFDFGAMNTTKLDDEARSAIGTVLGQAIWDTVWGGDFISAVVKRIDNAPVQGKTRLFLNAIKKDFFALGDYINVLKDPAILRAIFAQCITSPHVHPQIATHFKSELGLLESFVMESMKGMRNKAGVTINLPARLKQANAHNAGVHDEHLSYLGTLFDIPRQYILNPIGTGIARVANYMTSAPEQNQPQNHDRKRGVDTSNDNTAANEQSEGRNNRGYINTGNNQRQKKN